MLTAEEVSLTEEGRRRGRLTAEEYREAEFGLTVAESRRGFKIHTRRR